MNAIPVLVVDFNPSFLQTVVRFLQERADFGVSVVGSATRADEAMTLVARHRPQVVVVGINGNVSGALAIIAALRSSAPALRIVAMAQLAIAEYRSVALNAGADDFLGKDHLHRQLIPAIIGAPGAE